VKNVHRTMNIDVGGIIDHLRKKPAPLDLMSQVKQENAVLASQAEGRFVHAQMLHLALHFSARFGMEKCSEVSDV